MASGWGINGTKGRCYDFWVDFSECMSRCREPKDCALLREDYLECLHHSKEVILIYDSVIDNCYRCECQIQVSVLEKYVQFSKIWRVISPYSCPDTFHDTFWTQVSNMSTSRKVKELEQALNSLGDHLPLVSYFKLSMVLGIPTHFSSSNVV
ncbi:hypothetical protein Golax_023735 [Gossypium laxum]|uniref:Uncharacterized protein n=1 Tax=Gossypium laxum TaxID=34288 RepID=A0A7J8Z9V9_9ROSI|nr:hypothetical protein [Gossypium laxum]